MNLSVFILAAGLGERLCPITDYIPKPLLPILGKPVLQYVIEKLAALPVYKIGINFHHKKEGIETWIKQSVFSKHIEFFPENPILGTGGALKNAKDFLKNSTFLVHNSDIISDIDLNQLIEYHISSDNLATLAVHDYPEFDNLIIDENGYLIDIQHKILKQVQNDIYADSLLSCRTCFGISCESLRTKRLKAFTGIAVYQPEFLNFLPIGVSSVIDAWFKAISAGHKIGTKDVSGCYWRDIGTPLTYAQTVINELRKSGETVYIHPSVEWCGEVEMDGYVVIEEESNLLSKQKTLPKDIFLRNCIVLPRSNIQIENEGKWKLQIENCILGPGFQIQLYESEMLGFPTLEDLCHDRQGFLTSPAHNMNVLADGYDVTNAILIGTGGSDRKYFRLKKNGKTAVLMRCVPDDPDFEGHIKYTEFFRKYSIPVPELLEVDIENNRVIFEDLGDISLYSWLKCPRGNEQIEEIYVKVINALVLIHTITIEHISECPLLQSRLFDYEHLRWETSYFTERFVKEIKNIEIKDPSELNKEFHRLALKVDSFPKTLIHRDFQSQNIMITKGGIPRILDYQGVRIGPPAYDVVSLLWDPYYRLEDDVRERLLNYYIKRLINPHQSPFSKGGLRGITKNEFREMLIPCRLQRHMQALGAYGFLSGIKGKKYFLKYVPEGLKLLKEDVTLSKKEYPELYSLVMGLL
jgi:NDP-sugar pyrophosphorylase family protein/aminoglycoside/choline kinase family phosphotransferase